ncbi:phosphonate ABC transporter ATP-binding protein [Gorillibacterium massiliense]|uniref:phosphonate ABC transporter ATP-binding protein n=1 Tax=Gorillibacterium massiliense TaxID=1280390 RepID=UPI0004B2A43E
MIVRNMSKSHEGKSILSGISFQADPGEFIALVGASGSGKTTLLRCLTLKDSWDQGEFVYEGKDLLKANLWEKFRVKSRWAFLEENPNINPNKTAVRNVLGARWQHMPIWRKITRRSSMDEHFLASDFLEKVGLLDKGDAKVEKLSGGEKQRVALAKALVQEAKMICADDPVKGLDPQSVERIMQDFRKIAEKEKIIVICAMQQLELAERFATRIWGLKDGKIMLDIPARRLTLREKNMIF